MIMYVACICFFAFRGCTGSYFRQKVCPSKKTRNVALEEDLVEKSQMQQRDNGEIEISSKHFCQFAMYQRNYYPLPSDFCGCKGCLHGLIPMQFPSMMLFSCCWILECSIHNTR